MILGSVEGLRDPGAVIIDLAGYHFFFPGQPLQLGNTFELNDHRAKVVGIVDASAPFTTFPIFYSRYSNALNFVGQERKMLSFVLVKGDSTVSLNELCSRIRAATSLQAMTSDQFGWMTIWYYIRNTGLPINFGLTVAVALIVGTVVAGQTFYIFTIENLKQFGALKAIGTTNVRIIGMILLQALLVGVIGYALGMGLTASFFTVFERQEATRGIFLLWEVLEITAAVDLLIVLVASFLSVRRVLVLEPAVVFRG